MIARWFLFILIALIPLGVLGRVAFIEQYIGGRTILPVMGYATVLVWLLDRMFKKSQFKYTNDTLILIAFLTPLLIASVNAGISANISSFATYFQCTILLVMVADMCKKSNHLIMLGWILILSLSGISLLIVLDKAGFIHMNAISYTESMAYDRAEGTTGDPNVTSLQLIVALPFIIFYFFASNSLLKKAFLAITGIVILSAIISTASVGALIALSSILFTVLLIESSAKRRQTFIFVLLIAIGLAFWVSHDSTYIARYDMKQSAFHEGNIKSASSSRIPLLIGGTKTLLHHLVLGTGASEVAKEVGRNTLGGGGHVPHNILLHVGIEGGLLCLSIFLIFLIKTMKKTYGSMKKVNDPNLICLGHAIFTALVGFLVMSMTLSSPKVKYLWVLLGMALVYSSIIEDGRTSENNKYFS